MDYFQNKILKLFPAMHTIRFLELDDFYSSETDCQWSADCRGSSMIFGTKIFRDKNFKDLPLIGPYAIRQNSTVSFIIYSMSKKYINWKDINI